jgi:general secretion pathway protein G
MNVRKRRAIARLGFTLMEVLAVMAILVVLAGTGGVIYMRYLDNANKDAARIQAQIISDAVQTYSIQHGGTYPATLEELTQSLDGGKAYLEPNALLDPWGRKYEYVNPGQHNVTSGKPDIYSHGPRPGDPNGVIGNWTALK